MKLSLVSLVGAASMLSWILVGVPGAVATDAPTPILVELFTSEACSSCPPADKFLETLQRQPVPGADIVVLSEHVDYWNQIGWKDPYSSHLYSERQNAYAQRFGLDGPYTPQMVVDGTSQFVGSDTSKADAAFDKAVQTTKVPLHLSSISIDASHTLHAHLESGPLDASFHLREVDVYIAVALNHAETQVTGGENTGHNLTHVAVVRSLTKVGGLKQAKPFAQDVQIKLDPKWDNNNLRLIAFLQEPHEGKVLGAASSPINAK